VYSSKPAYVFGFHGLDEEVGKHEKNKISFARLSFLA